jgi:hypothetical protein
MFIFSEPEPMRCKLSQAELGCWSCADGIERVLDASFYQLFYFGAFRADI